MHAVFPFFSPLLKVLVDGVARLGCGVNGDFVEGAVAPHNLITMAWPGTV